MLSSFSKTSCWFFFNIIKLILYWVGKWATSFRLLVAIFPIVTISCFGQHMEHRSTWQNIRSGWVFTMFYLSFFESQLFQLFLLLFMFLVFDNTLKILSNYSFLYSFLWDQCWKFVPMSPMFYRFHVYHIIHVLYPLDLSLILMDFLFLTFKPRELMVL